MPGYGGAASAIEKQFQRVVKEFPDIAGIHQWGTLNVLLQYPLRIINPDFTTSAIEWEPGRKEMFSLTTVGLQKVPMVEQPFDAWVYAAHASPHRGNALMVEIVAPTIQINDGDSVAIYLPPYRYSSCVLL